MIPDDGDQRELRKGEHRLDKLEKIATSFKGVDKAYAVHAGRELRVIVESDQVNRHPQRLVGAQAIGQAGVEQERNPPPVPGATPHAGADGRNRAEEEDDNGGKRYA